MERYVFNDLSSSFVDGTISVSERTDHVAITVGKPSIRGVSVKHSVAFGRLSTKDKDTNFDRNSISNQDSNGIIARFD